MKKGLTELIFILDRSGSMGGLEADTIGGFNSLLERQKKQAGEALVSTVLFDNETQVIHDRVPLADVHPMTAVSFGISVQRAANYHSDSEGTALNYEVLSQAVQAVCAGMPLSEDWKERIDQDFKKRKR